ncbi:MAG: endonuclease III [Bacteroidales bacterium]|nr:endonuclease III [Bacteroidales bacterium]
MLRKKERFRLILEYFQQHQPIAETELSYHTAYELLVAVMLSAQCTDKRVNMIVPEFFNRFPDARSLSEATQEEVFKLIKSCSYPNNKAKNLIGMATTLVRDFGGAVPGEVDELQRLPGVGRKTANVIASVVFDKPVLAVDTHVFRVAARLGLTTDAKTPLQAEIQLVKYIPESLISIAHHWLILHGRYTCQARKPKCHQCPLTDWCKWFSANQSKINLHAQQKADNTNNLTHTTNGNIKTR